MNLNCEIIVNSDVEHLQQIYTGFNMLHRCNFLTLKQTIPPEFKLRITTANRWDDFKFSIVKVIINKITVYYDMHDWNRIDEEILSDADFYFKRSYETGYVSQLAESHKVFPLGLNYPVTDDCRDLFRLERAQLYNGKDRIKTIIKSLKIPDSLGFDGEAEQLKNLESLPNFTVEPKILFMARAWDTNNLESKEQAESVEAINEGRAKCVRLLRKEFGAKFYGGLAHNEYAAKNFKDSLLPDNTLSNKRQYLKILKNYPICVATTGLNRSNGWKLGEYVALSKAIVTEPLHFQVTGNFAPEVNYLKFETPDKLIESATRLFENNSLRHLMMLNNHRYYQSYLRPDSLILNSLAVVADSELFAKSV